MATTETKATESRRNRSGHPRAHILRRLIPQTASILIAGTAACIVFSTTFAFAATSSPGSNSFGAETEVITSCGSGLTLGYMTGFSKDLTEYTVKDIDLSNIPAGCLGKTLSLTFYDSAGKDVGLAVNSTLPTTGTTQTIPITPDSNTIDATDITGISLVVP